MAGDILARAGDSIVFRELVRLALDDYTRARIAELFPSIEARLYLFRRVDQALASHRVDDFLDQVGPRSGFADQAFLCGFDGAALRAGADKRTNVSNQHAS